MKQDMQAGTPVYLLWLHVDSQTGRKPGNSVAGGGV